ncbi:TraR/DksA C4-type zinc finger protein [Planococcus sp. ISL-109]|uniref:TraR/DksA C4-type zinc finger protein n=1 Tax=Planococcus sp. ISL-109 TaxID=2819166 RepID=UPI001BEB6B03|nr:TraR/DksA C4-type zinc finger protein [Planococcus sp. ISL-109]MBT2581496.1 TraR/DksA C4-type zinc finger protein [Planococcus sp. ISL-109]
MTDEQLKQLKEELKAQLKSIEGRLEHKEEFETSELSNYDNHPADNATDLYDQERGMAMDHLKEEEHEDILAALKAIEEGTYGKCAVCGKDIPFERLEALPTTLTCIDHADHSLDFESRPAEEDFLGSSTDRPVKPEDNRIRDYDNSFGDVESFGSSDGPQDQPGEDSENFYKDDKTDDDNEL